MKDTLTSYGWTTIVIHWLSALLIIGLFALGLYMTSLSYYDNWYHQGPWWHVSIGVILFFVTLYRLVWRIVNPTPTPEPASLLQHVLASAVKRVLYAALFVVLISGYLITTAEGKAASVFDWFGIPATLQLAADGVDLVGKIHLYGAWLIIVLALLHAGAALYHHFVKRDATLRRMLKPTTRIK